MLALEIYKRKNIENCSSSKVNDIVLRLMNNYLNKGHHIFMDNIYNSFGLSVLLLEKDSYDSRQAL